MEERSTSDEVSSATIAQVIEDDNDINLQDTQNLQRDAVFQRFLDWCDANGLKRHPNLMVPAAFGSLGIPGIAASERLEANTVIAAVPNKMLITLRKIKDGEMRAMIKDRANAILFDENKVGDAEFNIIAAYLIREKLKGEDSFFKPYFDTITRSYTMYDWQMHEVEATECPELIDEFSHYVEDMEVTWRDLRACLVKYPDLFKESDLTKEIFLWSYELIMTRIFGYSLPCTCLVPFGDLFNHGNHSSTHYIVNKKFEEDTTISHEQYKIKKNKIDLSLFRDEGKTEPAAKDEGYHWRSKRLKFVKEHYKVLPKRIREAYDWQNVKYIEDESLREMVYEINAYELAHNKEANIWDLKYFTTEATEDNDTDEDQTEGRKKEYQSLYEKELQAVEKESGRRTFVEDKEEKKDEKNEIKEIGLQEAKQRLVDQNDSSESSGFEENSQYDEADDEEEYDDDDDEEEEVKEGQERKKNASKEKEKDDGKVKTVKKEQAESEDDNSDSQSSLSDDSKWDWYENDDRDTYFAVTTEQPVEKGQQIFLCYGRRTNKFLLQWYGFAFKDNLFDSFGFRMWIKPDPHALVKNIEEQIVFRKYISEDHWTKGEIMFNGAKINTKELTKEFRLKRGVLCNEFVVYLRIYLSNHYNEIDISKILFTLPYSLGFELFVFEFALRIFNYMHNQYTTSVEEDTEKLKDITLPYRTRFALVLRRDHKRILEEQIGIVKQIISILRSLQESQFNLSSLQTSASSQSNSEEQQIVLTDKHTNDLKNTYMLDFEDFNDLPQLVQQRHKIKHYLKQLYLGIYKKYTL